MNAPLAISLADLPAHARQNRWFASLPLMQQQALLRNAQRVNLHDDQWVSRKNHRVRRMNDGFAMLLTGSLKVSSTGLSGHEAIFTYIHPGQWFGELALLDQRMRERDVRSIGESELLVIDAPAFALLMQDPMFAEAALQLLSNRTRMLLDLMEDLSLRTTRARTARRLVMLARDDDPLGMPIRQELKISHDALASMIGMSRQALSIQLKTLNDVGAIAQGYGRISIRSIVLLMAEAAVY